MQRTYPHGVPCWVDTEQTDAGAAREFYGGLFGWSFEDAMPPGAPGSYLIASLGGRDVAAIAPDEGNGAPAWNTYVAVESADETAAAVSAAGGTVLAGPMDAGPGGRYAICADPRGARFRLWQANRRLGAQAVNEPGTWNFSDLRTSEPDLTSTFYAPLFGWAVEDMGFATLLRRPGYGDHLEATVDPGIRSRQEGVSAPPGFEDAIAWVAAAADGPDHWHVTFAVADRDEAAATAERLGASILASEDTPWTRTAHVRDPQGAELTLSQFTPPGG
jgi:predicted enzyme related to lactoylglutathione lyase